MTFHTNDNMHKRKRLLLMNVGLTSTILHALCRTQLGLNLRAIASLGRPLIFLTIEAQLVALLPRQEWQLKTIGPMHRESKEHELGMG